MSDVQAKGLVSRFAEWFEFSNTTVNHQDIKLWRVCKECLVSVRKEVVILSDEWSVQVRPHDVEIILSDEKSSDLITWPALRSSGWFSIGQETIEELWVTLVDPHTKDLVKAAWERAQGRQLYTLHHKSPKKLPEKCAVPLLGSAPYARPRKPTLLDSVHALCMFGSSRRAVDVFKASLNVAR